ncbi:nickel transport system ATP-binding protein [Paenibacillus sp. V4I3]|uniref:ABC transporter ATP-binding protein n=1 Tax=Paenibacillus sp. V4I3 TaxID=3042305 RepID=UPI00277EB4DF|nr:dipeptide/oligopeptide/nickel ABC transporter ATP-binding protein [Paenibacillus sp. V4I3]MDQ0875702.1 nickel transport system ATP-binding protein [Paenibacillus sp. V4I3]
MNLLEVSGVSKSYQSERTLWGKTTHSMVLHDISFDMLEGECLGIVGESGSGKSTLGKLVLGLVRPDKGRILFQKRDWLNESARDAHALRRNLQAVFQNCSDALNPRMTARQIIAEPLLNYERYSARKLDLVCLEWLDAVGLASSDADKLPHQFSGGQQQRLCIARALALHPKLIVLDEAVSSLDRILQAQILELLQHFKMKYRLSYLFISHDIKATRYLSDRVAVMDRGEIVDWADSPNHLEQLQHSASRKLLDSQLPSHPDQRTRRIEVKKYRKAGNR